MPKLWQVRCQENKYPGMWQRWFKSQCVAVGWSPDEKYHLEGPTIGGQGWNKARKAIKDVAIGDHIIVTLKNHCVGRIGAVVGKRIEDDEWDPLVPRSRESPAGEMGRRILVRWDLNVGPDSRDLIVALPSGSRFLIGELMPAISKIRSRSIAKVRASMNNELNWVGLLTYFDYERALSGYIAAYPHRLEDGLLPHPNERVREKVFDDNSRSDVLLTDRNNMPVVVECKQGRPELKHLKQLRRYMRRLGRETRQRARGILVHGGARKLAADISAAAKKAPRVEIVQYSLDVDFSSSN